MLFVCIDAVDTRNVVGFECGTRDVFDKRHGGDPLWFFFDNDLVGQGVKIDQFSLNPRLYQVTSKGRLKKNPSPSTIPDLVNYNFANTDVLPAGVSVSRAAGSWSRTKKSTTTVIDFTTGVLDPRFSLQRAAGPWSKRGYINRTFTPDLLFADGAAGTGSWWYDPSDLSTMWQDTAKTVPAAVDQPVAVINDKSPNARHWVVKSNSGRPILRKNGSIYWLEFDGVDDGFTVPYAGTDKLDLFMAFRRDASESQYVLDFGTGSAGGYIGATQVNGGGTVGSGGAPAYYVNRNLLGTSNVSRQMLLDNTPANTDVIYEIRDLALNNTNWNDHQFGNYTNYEFKGRFYGSLAVPTEVANQGFNRARTEAWLATKAGRAGITANMVDRIFGLEKDTASNTPRFDYDPPVENLIPFSDKAQQLFQNTGTYTAVEQSGVTKYTAGQVPQNYYAVEYFNTGAIDSEIKTYAVDLRGENGGEIVWLYAQASVGFTAWKRLVLTTSWQRFYLTAAACQFWGFGNHNSVSNQPLEPIASPGQTYYAKRRQLNKGPIPLAFTATTGTAVSVPALCRGLMIEPERTNLMRASDNLLDTTYWSNSGSSVSKIQSSSPTSDSYARVNLNAGSFGTYEPLPPPPANLPLTISAYRRSTQGRSLGIGFNGGGNATNNRGGSVVQSGEWQRDSYTLASFASDSFFYATVLTSSSFAGGDQQSAIVDVAGAQVEVGSRPSSYIPTTTGPATRSREIATITFPHAGDGIKFVLYTFSDNTTFLDAIAVTGGVYTHYASDSTAGKVISSITYYDLPSGMMELGTAANTPRFEHDPNTGVQLGLLVEPGRTNYHTNSDRMRSGWFNSMLDSGTSLPLPGLPPLSRGNFVPLSGGDRAYQSEAVPAGSTVSASFFVRGGTGVRTAYIISEFSPGYVGVDLSTGDFKSDIMVPTVSRRGPGFRLGATFVKGSSGNYNFYHLSIATVLRPSGVNHADTGFYPDGSEFAFYGAAQQEVGDRPTSYIPTTTSTATRPVEVVNLVVQTTGHINLLLGFVDGSTQEVSTVARGGKVAISGETLTGSFNVVGVRQQIGTSKAPLFSTKQWTTTGNITEVSSGKYQATLAAADSTATATLPIPKIPVQPGERLYLSLEVEATAGIWTKLSFNGYDSAGNLVDWKQDTWLSFGTGQVEKPAVVVDIPSNVVDIGSVVMTTVAKSATGTTKVNAIRLARLP